MEIAMAKLKEFLLWLKTTFGGMVTEHDNKTHDIVKHGGWVGLIAVIAHDAYLLHTGVPVGVKDFSIAITTVLAGVGVGVAVKRSGEHDETGKGSV
jgi:hypothetical protein